MGYFTSHANCSPPGDGYIGELTGWGDTLSEKHFATWEAAANFVLEAAEEYYDGATTLLPADESSNWEKLVAILADQLVKTGRAAETTGDEDDGEWPVSGMWLDEHGVNKCYGPLELYIRKAKRVERYEAEGKPCKRPPRRGKCHQKG